MSPSVTSVSVRLLTASVLCAPLTVAASPLAEGLVCTLQDSIALKQQRGAGQRVVLRRGTSVTVLEPGKRWTVVDSGGTRGSVKSRWLSKICKQDSSGSAAEQAAPADALPADALPADAPPLAAAPPPVADGSESEAQPQPASEPSPAAASASSSTSEPSPAAASASGSTSAFGETYRIKVAVMTLAAEGLSEQIVGSLTNTVAETLDGLGPFKAISSQDIMQMLAFESQKQMLGCDDVSCLAEIGGALGADFLVTGSITSVGHATMLQLQLMSIRESRVDNRVSRQHTGPDDGLFDAVKAATKQLVREILGERSGRLAVRVTEEGATISVDGSIVGVSPLSDALTVAGGSHTLSVEKRGFVLYRQDVNILADRETAIEARLKPSAEFIKRYRDRAGFVRTISWTAIGAGAAALLGGASLYLGTRGKVKDLNRDTRAYNAKDVQARAEYARLQDTKAQIANLDLVTTLAVGVGLVSTSAGVLLHLLGDDPARYDVVTTSGPGVASVSVGPHGITIGGHF